MSVVGIGKAFFMEDEASKLLIAGLFGIYLASAIVVNTAFGKKVYPMPGPIIK